jgi:tripartite-type tricarboxylate transporter receptor subunit TctC
MNVLSEPMPFHLDGKMRILAISAPARSPRLPDVPTFAEAGFPELTRQEWFGVLLPAGTPPGVVQPMHQALVGAVRTPEVQEVLTKLEFTPEVMEPAAFAARMRAERESWGPIVAASGFKPEE